MLAPFGVEFKVLIACKASAVWSVCKLSSVQSPRAPNPVL